MVAVGGRFECFISGKTNLFRTRTRECFRAAKHYLCGLIQAKRKNIERMEEVVPDSDYQAMQQFITDSPWDHEAVFDSVAHDADALLGGSPDSCLLVDETGFAKKGARSVGVARQWNGRLGKVDNCQVGVFSALCRGEHATLVGARLYLPKEWIDDTQRLDQADVPQDERTLRPKADLALELVLDAQQQGLRYGWVGADAGYGKDPQFLRALEDFGETFMVDVHCDQHVWLQRPAAGDVSVRVDEWTRSQRAGKWRRMTLRQSTKGPVQVEVMARRVWAWDREEEEARSWWLVVRRDPQTKGELKYSLSNAPEDTSWQRLAYMQGQRYWIERAFEDAKGSSGLGHYQVRGWRAWHHHVALVSLAMLFMTQERVEHRESVPLLSCADIEVLLAHFLPRRDVTLDEILRQMDVRHQKRQASIDVAYASKDFAPPGQGNRAGGLTK